MTEILLFGAELKSSRKRRLMTQERAAELLDISTRWFQTLEVGKAPPSFELTCRIVKYFEIDLSKCCVEENDDYTEIAN